jgi:hypothetical protein
VRSCIAAPLVANNRGEERPDEDAEIARLAALPTTQYERERVPAAEKLGFRVSILDKLVIAARGSASTPGQGRPLELYEPQPWPDSVNGAELLDTIATEVRRYVVLDAAEADEADTYMRDSEDLRAVIDSGHRRDGGVIRTVGDAHEPRRFSTWAPVVLAAIGHLPGTVEDRSIKIAMRRRRPDEPVMSLRLDRTGGFEKLARMAARWARDNADALRAADPPMPAGIYNRAADNWHPLFAVADIARGGWPARARKAAVKLLGDGEDVSSATVLLLGDLRELFDHEPSGVLFTREILAALHADETRPWPEWKTASRLPIAN